MSYQEREGKKRKTAHNASSNNTTSFDGGSGGRDWTLSIAVPTSILSNVANPEHAMHQAGRIARALAIFSVDEVVIFDDTPPSAKPRVPADPDAYTGDTDPAHYLHHVLSYLEAPPFMRKTLFPLHPNLRFANKLPGLDMPHHPHPKEWLPFGEGVTLADKTSTGKGTLVNCGHEKPVEIKEKIPPKTRITLRFPDDDSQSPEPVHPDTPRTEGGYAWGYQVRKCSNLTNVFTECPYEGGYDVSIGTSERGTTIPQAFVPNKRYNFNHIMVVFGGPRGLEYAAMNDEGLAEMGIQGPRTKELFDHWVNALPNQGSRSIQTEEAVFIALTALRGIWER